MKELTKEMLDNWHITIECDKSRKWGYKIMHLSRNHRGKDLIWKEIKPVINGKYHPKSKQIKQYYIIGWSDYANTKKQVSFPLARVIYAWFYGCVPADKDVDHIEDSLDNSLDNLQLLTRAENLRKRRGWVNQYGPRKVINKQK